MVNSKELLDNYRIGRDDAAGAIFERYVARMRSLADRRIASTLKRRFEADDVVQSAFRSFFVHAKEGEYQLERSGDLWRLLASITLHKLQRQIERQKAAKRSVHRELSADDFNARLMTREATAVEAAALAEELQQFIDGLSPDEQLVLTSTLQGQDIPEISKTLGKSERTARRLLSELKRKLEQRLLAPERRDQKHASTLAFPNVPMRYSDYLLEQMLGTGGMGKVYRAKEKHSGGTVAIKAIHKSRQSDPRAIAQFVKEAEILAKLRHRNIVGVSGLGRFPGGGFFIVMDFIDGVDLQSLIQRGALSLKQSIAIVKDVANAIQFAHDQGVVHCDLKPANILLDQNGRVFVTDFGFGFLLAGTSRINHQQIGGTAGFIAPEVLLRTSEPTPGADVYAMGMLLWTLATGKSPAGFDHEANDLPATVGRICRRCVANDPKERYKSPSELASELEKLFSF